MGSPLRLQVAGGAPAPADGAARDDALVDAAWAAIRDEFEAAEQALSRFRETSEIHRLRLAGGRADRPSRRLLAALAAADRAWRVTDGRFDPRVLGDLERLGSDPLGGVGSRMAAPASRSRADRGEPIVRRLGRLGPIDVPEPVDFGGIGKGLALRWAARRASAILGDRAILLEAGGDIASRGRPGPDGWRIGIEDPRGPVEPPGDQAPGAEAPSHEPGAVIELPQPFGAVATSSVRRARWHAPDGREVHHLIDPRTGEPGGDGLLAVTVCGTDPAWAEVWSKSLFLEGRRGIAAVARARGLRAWWMTVDGVLEMTPGARELTIWVAAEAA
jgi:thiamine biosynthesis lipoprotein